MDKGYPKDFDGNIRYRAQLLKACEVDEVLRAEVKELCKKDILYWINCFCYTKDPRRKPDILPYITYQFQDEHILDVKNAIDNQHDLLNDKSRDMGVSWDILYAFSHYWLFEDGSDFRVGSRKEDFVDKLGDIDTLLEKIRFNLRRQPLWMLPKDFDFDKCAGFMRIINPTNGNAIIGESANEHFGSGGRRKAILLDEFAKWDNSIAGAAWTATADVSKCRIVVSTPVGAANKFAQLSLGTKEKIKKSTLHWTLHPDKAKDAYYLNNGIPIPLETPQKAFLAWKQGVEVRSPWYDAEAERRSESDLAQEVGIDYLASGHPFFSLKALALQKEWQFLKRKFPSDEIPYGRYITGVLIEIDNKIEFKECQDGWLRIFELPKEDWCYAVSGDVSEGMAKGDESFAVIKDRYTRNVVAACNGLWGTDDYAVKLQKIGKFYNDEWVAPENNNHGHSVCQDLQKLDCKLYYSKRVSVDGKETITKAGWTTDMQSRPLMLDQMEEEIRKGVTELRDPILISQCRTFIKNAKTGKPQADGEFLDDGVIACAIGSALIVELPFKAKTTNQTHAKQRRAVEEATKPMSYA